MVVVGVVIGVVDVVGFSVGPVGVSKQVPGGAVSLLLHTPFIGLNTRS